MGTAPAALDRVMRPGTQKLTVVAVAALAAALSSCGGSSSPSQPTPVPTPAPAPTPQVEPARYRVTFDATWSAATHPQMFPGNPHFSPLIGGTHSSQVVFWEPGGIASPGIEAMAEQGDTSPLDAEVQAAIAAGTAEGLIQGQGISRSPNDTSVEFQVGPNHPLVTLVSMLAPSPDWFVGVHGMSLLENGQWVEERVVALDPYDAGTDSGGTYRSANADTAPAEPIQRIDDAPLAPSGVAEPVGTFTFVLLPN